MAAFKDHFSLEEVSHIGTTFASNFPSFNSEAYISNIQHSDWEEKELKARIEFIARGLYEHSGSHFEELCVALIQTSGKLSGFSAWPLQTVIELYGLETPELALNTMAEITEKASAEFAIRPFLEQHKEITISKVLEWSGHENHHIRRLASEGTRPKLPWGQNVSWITQFPDSFKDVLETLSDDPSEYVRKSVANHTNDITKLNKDSALKLTGKWINGTQNQQKVAKHALRWLLKKGDEDALAQVGFNNQKSVSLESYKANTQHVQLGDKVTFSAEIENLGTHDIAIDVMMRMEYPGKKNSRTSVFNWKRGIIEVGRHRLDFSFSFENRSIRTLLAGNYEFKMMINGVEMGKLSVFLNPS